VSQSTTEQSLEQMAAELRQLAGQRVSAGLLDRANDPAEAGHDHAVALMAEVIRNEVRRALEQVGEENRQTVAGLVLDHSRGLKAQAERIDGLVHRIDEQNAQAGGAMPEGAASALARAIIPRLDHIIALQEELTAHLEAVRSDRRRSITGWVVGVVAALVLGIVSAPLASRWLLP
jgi:hypothetical protein